ncbi:hypothetical protein Vretimale_13294 [Volvox reticuliferus]|uniref:Uncharacterized protein n=1 Tax=Volvox reticuliferus TaxID=1737510 RepID=A0A8J4GJY6_9CHLO|nr:hypothetical protein Vretimale_13294 [Volvox reticuliferus]
MRNVDQQMCQIRVHQVHGMIILDRVRYVCEYMLNILDDSTADGSRLYRLQYIRPSLTLFFDDMHVLGGIMKDLLRALFVSNPRNSAVLMQYERDANSRFLDGKPPTILSKEDLKRMQSYLDRTLSIQDTRILPRRLGYIFDAGMKSKTSDYFALFGPNGTAMFGQLQDMPGRCKDALIAITQAAGDIWAKTPRWPGSPTRHVPCGEHLGSTDQH